MRLGDTEQLSYNTINTIIMMIIIPLTLETYPIIGTQAVFGMSDYESVGKAYNDHPLNTHAHTETMALPECKST